MKSAEQTKHMSFWTTIVVSFVLLIHNGTEPLFLLAYALLPIVCLVFFRKKSWVPLVIYLLIFGAVGRYTRYSRESYASDTLLAIRDYIGLFLSGKNPYNELVFAQKGLTPFTYLPMSIFWYLPAQVMTIDLRLFEMIVSLFVPLLILLIGVITNIWVMLPILSVVSLTPFLLDLCCDGSNDNSAIFLLLLSVLLLLFALKKKSSRWGMASAVVLAFASVFKHYVGFYLIFFIPYLWHFSKKLLYLKSYMKIFFLTMSIIAIPFLISAPSGFMRSLFFIEIGNYHDTWGWNVWVLMRDGLGLTFTKNTMWVVRTVLTVSIIVGFFSTTKFHSLKNVAIAGSISLFVYLILSNWTSYAYFTFLIPLMSLSLLEDSE